MRAFAFALCLLVGLAFAPETLRAQEASGHFVQLQALPSQGEAEAQAQAYGGRFPNLQGYRLNSGWYALMLGPYDSAEAAEAARRDLLAQGAIPADAYLTDAAALRGGFWPDAATAAPAATAPLPAETAAGAETFAPDESEAEAKASEAALPQKDREALQSALKWFGHYAGDVDGAIGSGTRKSMAAWQTAMGFEPTGVLTTRQRALLVKSFEDERQALGFETVTEGEAGIEIMLPLALVEFDRYAPPFVHYKAKAGADIGLSLISAPGEGATLARLYEEVGALAAVPPTGPRELKEDLFVITGEGPDGAGALAYGKIAKGAVKGYLLTWGPKGAGAAARVRNAMGTSFTPLGDRALDPGLVPLSQTARAGLLAGLTLRSPQWTQSGFYVSASGDVLTAAERLDECRSLTLDGRHEATFLGYDSLKRTALLRPGKPLAPRAVAALADKAPVPGAPVALAGYSFPALPAPVLTFGLYEAAEGQSGERDVHRLRLTPEEGDTGGPVLTEAGDVLGPLLPRSLAPKGAEARQLPANVRFAANRASLLGLLAEHGVTPAAPSADGAALSPDALEARARDLTVRVSCW